LYGWASLADLMGRESVETTKRFYALFQADELAREHQQFSPVASLARE
jgi:hypothetical protein